MDKKDIKIFVSHRIDQDSQILDNPLFVPVRCGAVYDKRKNIKMLGDNTGDNISEKRMSFCELTVLYWAWKNQDADYMGLCHYRRYIGFNCDSHYTKSSLERNNGCISIEDLSEDNILKYGLNEEKIRTEVEKYDAIFIEPIDLTQYRNYTNYIAMLNSPDYHNIEDMDLAIEIIKNKYPEMSDIVNEYMHKYQFSYLYNCFIMKRDLFNEFCSWLFDILFELETKINMETYTIQQYRTPGTIAERLLGIYILYLQKQNKYKIANKPLLFIENTQENKCLLPAFNQNNIPIISNFNNNYIPVFLAFLESFKDTMNTNNNYDFIILITDITEKSKKLIQKAINEYMNISIRYYNPNHILADVKKIIYHDCYSEDLYYRVVIPYLFPDYDKVLVVDVDTICQKDLAELFNTNIDEYYIGAVKDTVMQGYLNGARKEFLPYLKNKLRLINPYNYVNTGVLIFNCKKFRDKYTQDYIVNFIKENMTNVWIYEQDMINKLCDNNILFLDQTWNYFTQTSDFITKCISLSTATAHLKHIEISRQPNLIHYAANPKPWVNPDMEYAELWWSYARKTPFYELILKRMMESVVWGATGHVDYKLNILKNYKKICLKYWKYKILRNFVFGKTKDRYIAKKRKFKEQIRALKGYK